MGVLTNLREARDERGQALAILLSIHRAFDAGDGLLRQGGKVAGDGGSGIFRPEVTWPLGVKKPVIAWGCGLERLLMLRLGMEDSGALQQMDSDAEGEKRDLPVLRLYFSRFREMTASRRKILDRLPTGLDIEGTDDESVRIEYNPNRPDFSTDYGTLEV